MGYVHDTHTSEFIPPAACTEVTGTWATSDASNVVKRAKSASAETFTLYVPIRLPQNESAFKGARLKSIDFWYKIAAADATDFATVELEKMTLPVNGSAPAGAAVTVTLDADHDTAVKRKAQQDGKMTVTLGTPPWMDCKDLYVLKLVVQAAASTVFTYYGARVNFDMRV